MIRTAIAMTIAAGAAGSPLQLFGFGGRSPGVAATGVADHNDFASVYLNPAGLAEVRKKRLSVGMLVGTFDLEGVDRPVDPALGLELGGVLPIPFGGHLRERVGLGLGFYVPTRVLNRARTPFPGTPTYALLESRAQVVGIQVALGVRASRRWSIGAGLLALAALDGSIRISADAQGRFTTTSEQQLLTHMAPILGARFAPRPGARFGLVLRFPSRSAFDIRITNDLGEELPFSLPELQIAGVAQYDPLTLAVEGAFRTGRELTVSAQVGYERWSAFPLPIRPATAAGPAPEPPGFHDTVVPRLGVEWSSGAVALRGGLFFALTPAPEMTGQQALLDNHRIVFTLGAGLARPPVHVDAWAQTHVLMPRHHDRPDPGPDIDTSGAIHVAGLVVGVDL